MRRWTGMLVCLCVMVTAQASAKQGFVQVARGVKLHYLEEGKGKHTIVFVPGWTMWAEIWQDQLKRLSPTHRVLAVSMRSHGKSTITPWDNTPAQFARDLEVFLKQKGIKKPVLAGWSMGGTVLLEYVKQFGTDDLSGLIIVDGVPLYRKTKDWERGWSIEGIGQMATGLTHDRKAFVRQFLGSRFKKKPAKAYLETIVKQSMKTPPDTAVSLLVQVVDIDLRAEVETIGIPILVAMREEAAPIGDWYKKKLSKCTLEVFHGSGHFLFHENAERFQKVVEDFVSGL